jgi:ArsR family transcriptional regulator, arsenate/arsenite/antimonite-responsive transcriptional repressor
MNSELVFKALSDPNRIKILNDLCSKNCPCNVGEVACCCSVDLSVVSRHLNILKNAGVISSEKRGKQVFYHVNRKEVAALLRQMADNIEKTCCS